MEVPERSSDGMEAPRGPYNAIWEGANVIWDVVAQRSRGGGNNARLRANADKLRNTVGRSDPRS